MINLTPISLRQSASDTGRLRYSGTSMKIGNFHRNWTGGEPRTSTVLYSTGAYRTTGIGQKADSSKQGNKKFPCKESLFAVGPVSPFAPREELCMILSYRIISVRSLPACTLPELEHGTALKTGIRQ